MINKLENERKELLDKTLKNPLLNYKLVNTHGIRFFEGKSSVIYNSIINKKYKLIFLPSEKNNNKLVVYNNLYNKIINNNRTNYIQTALTKKDLVKRLLNLSRKYKLSIEEKGTNVLFLTFGMLKWFDEINIDTPIYAPLIIIPVHIDRKNSTNNFSIYYAEDEILSNYCLLDKLEKTFRINLPEINFHESSYNIENYFKIIEEKISMLNGWEILPNEIRLDCFSFNKYFMYKDLDLDQWNESAPGYEIIEALLSEQGFSNGTATNFFQENQGDKVNQLYNVLELDSSQENAINAVFRNKCTVIQGPPGTGKSQTIVNLITKALGENQKVLFVSEKKAALQVVKKRLDAIGLRDACIEVHSQNSSKKIFIEELKRVYNQDKPVIENDEVDNIFNIIEKDKKELNLYSNLVNKKILNSNLTIQQLYGELINLKLIFENINYDIPIVKLPEDNIYWYAEEQNQIVLELKKIENLVSKIGKPVDNFFYGIKTSFLEPGQLRLFKSKLQLQLSYLNAININIQKIKEILNLSNCYFNDEKNRLVKIGEFILQKIDISNCGDQFTDFSNLNELIDIINSCNLDFFDLELSQYNDIDKIIHFIGFIQKKASEYLKYKNKYVDILKSDSWEKNVKALKYVLKNNLNKKFKFLKKDYRSAINECKKLFINPYPLKCSEYIEVLSSIIECKNISNCLNNIDPFFVKFFGDLWNREKSDFSQIITNIKWLYTLHEIFMPEEIESIVLVMLNRNSDEIRDKIKHLVNELKENLVNSNKNLEDIVRILEYGNIDKINQLSTLDQIKFFEQWYDNLSSLQDLINLNHIKNNLKKFKLDSFIKIADTWDCATMMLVNLFKLLRYENLVVYFHNESEILKNFDVDTHNKILNEYIELDRKQLISNRTKLIKVHDDNLPTNCPNIGGMSVLRHEMNKKTRHLSIRRIMELAGPLVQKIKPIMMMSPLSIASYLDTNIKFDLIIFDEASQIKPVEAFGAIFRGKKIVVVGDNKQLPPSNFFEYLEKDQYDNNEDFYISDVESILDLFIAKGAQVQTLLMHYRSKNPSLISVSNKVFYNNQLLVSPASNYNNDNYGIKFHYNPNNYYERGRSRTNKGEAFEIARYVINFAKTNSDLSLGVVAFSTTQANEIQDALDNLLIIENSCQDFFSKKGVEEFFIKSLENTQGDERDVIIISVGYGKNYGNSFSQNFGPINKSGGERRLNVLFTRAKHKVEIFSSITDKDIVISNDTPLGVKILKKYLNYARIGQFQENKSLINNNLIFEKQIVNIINELGYECDLSLGNNGIVIDIAVKHPELKDKYILAILGDGKAYNAVHNTRDRDRLRTELLESNGWTVYRIWSLAWYKNFEIETNKLKKILELSVDNIYKSELRKEYPLIIKRVPRQSNIQNIFSPYRITTKDDIKIFSYYGEVIEAIISVEAPIHHDVLIYRLKKILKISKLTYSIKKKMEEIIDKELYKRNVFYKDSFYFNSYNQIIPTRKRNIDDFSYNYKYIAAEEMVEGIIKILQTGYCISRNDIQNILFKEFGFNKISTDMKYRLNQIIIKLIKEKKIKIIDDLIFLNQ